MRSDFNTRAENWKDEWLTPPEIIEALGQFDLDPCSPVHRPWDTAKQHYTVEDDGLVLPWKGRVWLNPPYGRKIAAWFQRMAEHGEGIALIFARTETKAWHDLIWPVATGFLFLRGRVSFYHVDGTRGGSSNAPSVLVAYGVKNLDALRESGIAGWLMPNVRVLPRQSVCGERPLFTPQQQAAAQAAAQAVADRTLFGADR